MGLGQPETGKRDFQAAYCVMNQYRCRCGRSRFSGCLKSASKLFSQIQRIFNQLFQLRRVQAAIAHRWR